MGRCRRRRRSRSSERCWRGTSPACPTPLARRSCRASNGRLVASHRERAYAVPDHSEVLLHVPHAETRSPTSWPSCFRSKPQPAARRPVHEALPAAVELYYDVFSPDDVLDQLYLQSEAELQAAEALAGHPAAGIDDDDVNAATRLHWPAAPSSGTAERRRRQGAARRIGPIMPRSVEHRRHAPAGLTRT